MELNTIALGIAVRLAREERQMTSNDLARQTGMTPSSLSRSERGVRMLELDEAFKIATTLGMTTNDLIEQAQRIEKSGAAKQHQQALKQLDNALKKLRQAALHARLGHGSSADAEPAPADSAATDATDRSTADAA